MSVAEGRGRMALLLDWNRSPLYNLPLGIVVFKLYQQLVLLQLPFSAACQAMQFWQTVPGNASIHASMVGALQLKMVTDLTLVLNLKVSHVAPCLHNKAPRFTSIRNPSLHRHAKRTAATVEKWQSCKCISSRSFSMWRARRWRKHG